MNYQVKIVSNRKLLKDFVNLPFLIYENDKNWVPPLRSEVRRVLNARLNPYFKDRRIELLNCYKNNEIIARIALIINNAFNNYAQFGFFESFNDKAAVQELFNKVETTCKRFNINKLEGPFNPNHYSELGMQTNKFGSMQSYFQTYNPAYYNDLLKENGFVVSKTLHTRKNNSIKEYLLNKYAKNIEVGCDQNFTIRSFDLNNFGRELETLRDIYNDAFSSNWHFLPVSKEEYFFTAKYLKWVADPKLIRFAEYNGKPVGVIQCIQDINPLIKKLNGKISPLKFFNFIKEKKKNSHLMIYAVGIKKSFQHTNVFLLLLNEMIEIARDYDVLETTWMSQENYLAIRAAERLGLKPDKEFIIYEKSLR